jgi:hypothetical protein
LRKLPLVAPPPAELRSDHIGPVAIFASLWRRSFVVMTVETVSLNRSHDEAPGLPQGEIARSILPKTRRHDSGRDKIELATNTRVP